MRLGEEFVKYMSFTKLATSSVRVNGVSRLTKMDLFVLYESLQSGEDFPAHLTSMSLHLGVQSHVFTQELQGAIRLSTNRALGVKPHVLF